MIIDGIETKIAKGTKDMQKSSTESIVSIDDVVSWLITQPNANGTLYLEHVVRQYMWTLQSAPLKLYPQKAINIFSCRTIDELNVCCNILESAPNYQQVNKGTSGALSAGLKCYKRYLEHLAIAEQFPCSMDMQVELISAKGTVNISLDNMVLSQTTKILSAYFSNGYRINSPIEMIRFRSFSKNEYGEDFLLTDDELKSHIKACGTMHDVKVYIVADESKAKIQDLASSYFTHGAKVIFYTEFYAKNENWLFDANVVCEEMLVELFRSLFPEMLFTMTYFGLLDSSVFTVLESEILRVWNEDILLTYDQLAQRLQYVPIERIKYGLGQNGDFIWNSVETFSHVSKIHITDEERNIIQDTIAQECNTRGYASFTELPIDVIADRNYELSITAIHTAVYQICLLDGYDKKGKIITRKGDVFDALIIMKEYCKGLDKCLLSDLLEFERELTGEVHRWIPMEAGYSVLVRIDRDNYVAEKYVHFDIDTIDAIIESIVSNDYMPLKAFTTFAAFPDCGQTWNLFLLESYCRRFSRKFRFDTPSVNSRNAGAIIRKDCNMNYTEIMTDAVMNADVLLEEASIGRFLFDSGYTGRSTSAKISKIIESAQAAGEGRG